MGYALGGAIGTLTKFDRKNYFYPDLPKGYQISQYDKPLVEGGSLHIKDAKRNVDKKVRIRRIHLEEDAAGLAHGEADAHGKEKASRVDFNRGGMPLMELVSEPDLASPFEARLFAEELRTILRYVSASDGDMEKGEMRIEANVSVRPAGSSKLPNYKVELKNINSFRAVEAAVEYDIKRQIKLLEQGKDVPNETRGWRDAKGITESQRAKEEAHDYRYFPEPDLPPIQTADLELERIRAEVPELPDQKRDRFMREFSLAYDAAYDLTRDRATANFFESSASELREAIDSPEAPGPATEEAYQGVIALMYNYFATDVKGVLNESGESFEHIKMTPENFADLIALIASKKISSRIAKDLLPIMIQGGGDPHEIIKDRGMEQVSDEGAISAVIGRVIEANPKAVADYKSGKTNAVQFLFGAAMRELKGAGNPDTIRELLTKELSKK